MLNQKKGDLYFQVQNKPLTISEKDLADLLDQSRMDPRLMEITTEFVRDFWWIMDSDILNKACKKSRNPFMIKAIIACLFDHCEIETEDRMQFSAWTQRAAAGIKDPNPQFLYIGVFPLFSKSAEKELTESLICFKRHGLLAKDLPFNKGRPGRVKSEKNPPQNKVDEIDLLKLKYVRKIKSLKKDRNLSNAEIVSKTGINRVFLSRILNNKIENISLEYLGEHSRYL